MSKEVNLVVESTFFVMQVHEPILTTHRADALKANFQSTYEQLSKVGLPIDLVTYYDDVGAAYPWVVQLPVQVPLPLS